MKYYIGVDLGGTNIAVGVTEESGKMLMKHSVKTRADEGYESVVTRMIEAVREVIRLSGIEGKNVAGVGVGVPGVVNNDTGEVLLAENLNWMKVPMAKDMERELGLPIIMGNDGDCAALGEMAFGNGRGLDNGILITIGTGIGSGIIIHRRVFCGATGASTEAGHMCLVYDGEECGCGNRGCFEAYASCTALIKQTKRAMEAEPDSYMNELARERGKVDGRTAFMAAKNGDKAAQDVIDRYTSYLATGIAALVAIFRPQIVIIGGGVSNEGEPLLEPVNRKLQTLCYAHEVIAPPRIVQAKLGNDAGIIGAALLCVND